MNCASDNYFEGIRVFPNKKFIFQLSCFFNLLSTRAHAIYIYTHTHTPISICVCVNIYNTCIIRCYILRSKYMFRPVVAIIRFYHSTHLRLFYTIRVAACLMRRSQHQNPCLEHSTSILGVWVNHVIIHTNI